MSRRFLVTRHPGALQWLRSKGFHADEVVPHLELNRLRAGDVVVGTLPVHLAAQVCRRGARYFHLALEAPPEARGRELTPEDMERYGARLEEMVVQAREES